MILSASLILLSNVAYEMDSFTSILSFAAVIGIVLVIISLSTDKTKSLPSSFRALGSMAGKHKDDIISIVGPPNVINTIHDGELLHWIATDYKIAIKVDAAGVFEGVHIRLL